MTIIQERYRPLVIAANATAKLDTVTQIAGFLALTSGTILVKDSTGTTIINAVPVTAGVYTPMPFIISNGLGAATGNAAIVTLGGGASGTLAVA